MRSSKLYLGTGTLASLTLVSHGAWFHQSQNYQEEKSPDSSNSIVQCGQQF